MSKKVNQISVSQLLNAVNNVTNLNFFEILFTKSLIHCHSNGEKSQSILPQVSPGFSDFHTPPTFRLNS